MLFVKAGIKRVPIDVGEYLVKCPSCESDKWADVLVICNYYHFYHVPIFPAGKDATVFCKTCGLRREGAGFNSRLVSNFEEIKGHYRNPWYTYIGITLASLFILLLLTVATMKALS